MVENKHKENNKYVQAGLEAFNDSLRIEASPVHLVLIEPGELFSLTPMGSKQTLHYKTIKEARDLNPKETKKIENLQDFFRSLNPGLGMIAEEHGVYRWEQKSTLTSKLNFSDNFSPLFTRKILKDFTPPPALQKGSPVRCNYYWSYRTLNFRLRETLMVYSPFKLGDRLKKQLVGFDI